MFKGARKEDLRVIAQELNLNVEEKMTIVDLSELIKSSDVYKNEPKAVKDMADEIIQERKTSELKAKAESEDQKERIKLELVQAELELAKIRQNSSSDISDKVETRSESLDAVIKSIRTLTVKLPTKPEGWAFFFSSLERAFVLKNVGENHKAEILLNLLGEKANHILTYLGTDDLVNYNKVKEIVLREFQPTPLSCLEYFRKANRLPNETYVQFASRLITMWEYYLNLRDVSDFETLKLLIVSDKMFQTLDRETASHISVRQKDKWFHPPELGSEIDLYLTSKTGTVMGSSYRNFSAPVKNSNAPFKNSSKVFLQDVKNFKCVLCNLNHSLFKCSKYLNLPVKNRVEVVKRHHLCWNCLGYHRVYNCKEKQSCFCGERHNKTLHFPKVGTKPLTEKAPVNQNSFSSHESLVNAPVTKSYTINKGADELSVEAREFVPENSRVNLFAGSSNVERNKSKVVLLSTAICYLKDKWNNFHKFRAVLDVGAMVSFISKRAADELNLKRERINIEVSGISGSSLMVKARINTILSNEDGSFESGLDFLVADQIANLMPSKPVQVDMKELSDIKLADDNFNKPGPVDLLLGAEIFYQLLKQEQLKCSSSKLILQNTVFGFVVAGTAPALDEVNAYCGFVEDSRDLSKTLEKFWEVENVDTESSKSKESLICEEHYQKTHMRTESGRYVVKMPLKENPSCLGNSRDLALKRLNSLWKRLSNDINYLELYSKFLQEYAEMGHMIEIKEEEEQSGSYYIPHLGVYRGVEKSGSTPLRVVYNASALTTKGNSLNSIQFNGGVIQDDLFSIMLRFRKHIFAFTADIRKMYRMIDIHPDQRHLQKILWREGLHEPVKTFQLTTVTYGTVSAPFLAMRTLKQLAIDEGKDLPLAAVVLQSDLYMDDVLTGSDTLESAKDLQRQLIEILKRGCMSLHKWCSNTSELSITDNMVYPFTLAEETSALGVLWRAKIDCLCFQGKNEMDGKLVTKRSVLSTIATLFDPLGLVGPVILKAKIFMQKLWLLNLDWNDPLPVKEAGEWKQFYDDLGSINSLAIERCILVAEASRIEIHGFADASESAYGATVYCKSYALSGEVKVTLVTSKSRVSPLKKLSIPRLELCAAVLLAKLIPRVLSALKIDVDEVFLWSDSMIVLSWLNKEPHLLKTFVANRVAKIQELTLVEHWRHVPSEMNPADLVSRGLRPSQILQCELWWNGPSFLKTDQYPEKNIPEAVIVDDFSNELKILKNNYVFNVKFELFIDDFLNLSNKYTKLIRIMSYIYRYCQNCRSQDKNSGPLNSKEIKAAELILVRAVQQREFKRELADLQENGKVSEKSKIKSLLPFLDSDNVIRVGGRLANSKFDYDKKFPIILPRGHKLTNLIVEMYHKKYLHVGPQTLLFLIRQKFWILSGRSVCRKIVHQCIVCFKVKPVTCQQVMGQLPEERVTRNFPFNCVGVDFTGSYFIKYPNQRKGVFNKVYVCIFVCFVTKACHLDIVTDLSSDAFIATLKRFIGRRGKSAQLFSDNASNFVGSDLELKRLSKFVSQPDEKLSKFLANEGIEWNFIPPRSPNHGGLWEAGIKSVKYHLKRVVGNAKLTYEELLTVIVQIEAILNSRPLYPMSSQVEDFEVLTPGHFLIGRPITSIVEPSILNLAENRLNSWQRVSRMVQIIWKKWTNNYLSTLQQRSKWQFQKNNIKVGDMVILKEDNLFVCNWPLGRIVEVIQGKDGQVRVVMVKTKNGIFKRSINKICLLPLNESM